MPSPSYSSANGYISEQFVTLQFDISLDAANPPAISDFAVQVNGTGVSVTSVTVDSAAHTVRLGLGGAALLAGDIVDFIYTDPTSGNDVNAIQGLDGTDSSSFTNSTVVAIGRPVPPPPSSSHLSSGSDSGVPGDNVTNVTAPTITGTAGANATVRLYDSDGTTLLGTTTANGAGSWSIVSSVLTQGVHSLTATQTDSSNNTSARSSALNLTIDTTAPAASPAPVLSAGSDSGVQGDRITNVTMPTVTGTAEAGSVVTLYDSDGTTVLATAVANGSGAYSITSSALGQGSHALTIKATDAAGNVSTASPALNLTIDTIAPAASPVPVLSAGSDSGVQGDRITNVTTPTVTGTAEAGSTVTLYDSDGTTVLGTAVANGSGAYSITSSALSQGSHALTIKATDAAGNVSTASAALNLTIDTTAPATPSTAPILTLASDSGVQGDGRTNVTTPTVIGSAAVGTTVTLYDTDGTTVLGTALAGSSGFYSITSSTLGQGSHSLTVKTSDPAGNFSAASQALNLTIDTILPSPGQSPVLAAASDSGTRGDSITNVATPTLIGSAVPGSTVALYDGAIQLGTVAVPQSGAWSFTSGFLSDGVHQITAFITDSVGNLSPASQAFALTIDTAAPVVTATLLNDTGASSSDRITADATLTGNGDPNAVVTISENHTTLGMTVADGQGRWSFAPKGLVVGTHTLIASETDAAGNTSATQVSLRLDSLSAAAPTDYIPVSATAVSIVRFFDASTGTHFYTSSQSEFTSVVANRPDLKMEGKELNALNPSTVADDAEAAPVYRFFDTKYGTHFFTASTTERDAVVASRTDMQFEGVGFFEHLTQQSGDTAVYRFFDTKNGTHVYTTSETERASIISGRPDLTDEGIGFYAPKLT